MNLSPLGHKVNAADIPLERLASNTSLSPAEKTSAASRQFETVLVRQILQSAQKPAFKSKYNDSSTPGEIYHDMVSTQLADSISKSGSFGLAHSLDKQLTRQSAPAAGQTAPVTPQ